MTTTARAVGGGVAYTVFSAGREGPVEHGRFGFTRALQLVAELRAKYGKDRVIYVVNEERSDEGDDGLTGAERDAISEVA